MLNKLFVSLAFFLAHAAAVAAPLPGLDNAGCPTCHDGQKGKLEVADADGEKRELRDVHSDKYGKSVHAKMECVACHTDITDNVSPHKKSGAKTADAQKLADDYRACVVQNDAQSDVKQQRKCLKQVDPTIPDLLIGITE